jgi:crossover junction endodeoxyribonuclease RuvC
VIRVLGVDPGLTRCGVGIVDVAANRTASLVFVTVIRTPIDMPLEQRLLRLGDGFDQYLQQFAPQVVALEEVFAQLNTRTVMGTAQASGVAMLAAARRGLAVGLHTPTEVKAAITGYGGANKKQVATMVQRVLRLDAAPTPADAADALALAICHAWKRPPTAASTSAGATPAQKAWLNAERHAAKSAVKRRLGK